MHADVAAYNARDLNQQPTYGTVNETDTARAQPTVAAMMRWPFIRDAGNAGTQVVEPIVQLIAAPNAGAYLNRNVPNEDSLDYQFDDATLFSLNRYGGIDRFDGGLRANVGLHGSWMVDGMTFDGLVGQSYREHRDDSIPLGAGDNNHVSDVVARGNFTPVRLVRPDGAGAGVAAQRGHHLRRGGGLVRQADPAGGRRLLLFRRQSILPVHHPTGIQSADRLPGQLFHTRNEVETSVTTQYGRYKVAGNARYDVTTGSLDTMGLRGTYEDECFIFDVNYIRRYTSINGDDGGTTILFQITLKTVGQFGFHG